MTNPARGDDPIGAVDDAAATLLRHANSDVRRVGAWLATYPGGLLDHLGLTAGSCIARRDELLRQTRLPAGRLARELRHYRGTAWAARDRHAATNPYETGDLRSTLWRALTIRDRDLGKRQLERILRHPRTRNVAVI
jgi:hypothetical protein